MAFLGFDPGGINNFGVACINPDGEALCKTVSSAQEAFEAFDVTPIGIGVDAPLWWSTQPGGGRACDQWIRSAYKIPRVAFSPSTLCGGQQSPKGFSYLR